MGGAVEVLAGQPHPVEVVQGQAGCPQRAWVFGSRTDASDWMVAGSVEVLRPGSQRVDRMLHTFVLIS